MIKFKFIFLIIKGFNLKKIIFFGLFTLKLRFLTSFNKLIYIFLFFDGDTTILLDHGIYKSFILAPKYCIIIPILSKNLSYEYQKNIQFKLSKPDKYDGNSTIIHVDHNVLPLNNNSILPL